MQEEENSKKEPIPILILGAMAISLLVFNAIYSVVYYQIAVYVAETSIGNESFVGILSSLGTVGSFITCLLFGITYTKLKRAAIIPSYVIMAFCYLVLLLFPNVIAAIIACTIMGAAFGNGLSYFFMRCTVIVPPSQMSNSIGITTAVGGFGYFISTYMVTMMKNILGVDMNIEIFPILIGILSLGSILSVILTIRDKKNPAEYKIEDASA